MKRKTCGVPGKQSFLGKGSSCPKQSKHRPVGGARKKGRLRPRRLVRAALVCLVILVLLILLGIVMAPKPLGQQITYTVRPGETLWDIAREFDVENWQKWHYEVCEQNNIPHGGLISPGDAIVVFCESK